LPKVQPKFDVNERLFISLDDLNVVARFPGKLSARAAPRPLRQLRFRLFQPVRHTQVAVHRRCRRDMLLRPLARAGAPRDMAKTEVTMGDEGLHAEPLRQRQCLTVMSLAALGIELIGVGCDVAKQVQRMGGEPGLGRAEFECAVGETSRLVAPAQQQRGARQRAIEPGQRREDSACRQPLEQRLAFAEPVQRLTRLAE
jgi:hypothetical protein